MLKNTKKRLKKDFLEKKIEACYVLRTRFCTQFDYREIPPSPYCSN